MTDKVVRLADIEEMLANAQIISDGEYSGYCTEDVNLSMLSTADFEPVVRAHWIRMHVSVTNDVFACSRCKRLTTFPRNAPLEVVLEECPYCHCGAKMDEEAEK